MYFAVYGQHQAQVKCLNNICLHATWANRTRVVNEPHFDQPWSITFRPKKFRALWYGKLVIILTLAKSTKLLFSQRTTTFSRFFPYSKWSEHGRQNARTCLLSYTYGNPEWSVSTSSRGDDEGKIIGIFMHNRYKITVYKISRSAMGLTSLYKVVQRPEREAVHSPPTSITISS